MKYEYSMNNFESWISQAHKDKTEIRISLPALYSKKADENVNIQKMKNSVKCYKDVLILFLNQKINSSIVNWAWVIIISQHVSQEYWSTVKNDQIFELCYQ